MAQSANMELFATGHSRENAQKMAAPGSTVTFIKKDDGHYAQGIEYGGVYKELPFKLGEESSFPARARGEGVMIKVLAFVDFLESNYSQNPFPGIYCGTSKDGGQPDFVVVRVSPGA